MTSKKLHPEWCTSPTCYDITNYAIHRTARPVFVHRFGDCAPGVRSSDGEDFSLSVVWDLRHEGLYFEDDEWELVSEVRILSHEDRRTVTLRLSTDDLRRIADLLVAEADQIDGWRQAEIARRDQEAE